MPSSPVPQNNLVFSAFFEFEMKKSGPSPKYFGKEPATSSYSQFPGSLKKKNEWNILFTRTYEFVKEPLSSNFR